MKKTVFAMLALTVLSAVSRAEDKPEIPVFLAEQIEPNGQPSTGMVTMSGIISLLAAESGLKLVVHPYPWRRAQMKAKNGEGLLFGATETQERARVFNFTRPLYEVNQWLVTTTQRPIDFRSWEDLRGKIISISSGGQFGPEFEAQRGKTFMVEENAVTLASRFKMLDSGRVDAVLIDSNRTPPQLEVRLNCLFPGVSKWAVTPRPVNAEPAVIAVPKASSFNSYMPVLNEAIERMNKARTVQKYMDKRSAESSC
ncbi:transporter substrate-binding domain-containing protein [Pseudoduganella sp. FT25W]|uniref:Transporter substrate-binding domain-containing protein n=1 Tax=Duganella alba TaxID=2666081 RepID=A0A6L5QAZ0_9BURK|nr:transporter substrate-binding domain-containing protein [Duganella alba]MRX06876.1 transporter substrate-binding domain-containing protein [Duganella alba]MRX16227.1 transporter substrate-binding domain-containing protein [Duganella alba]